MKTKILTIVDPNSIKEASRILRSDGLIAIPTDTVYGLAGIVNSEIAIEKIYETKGRDYSKAIPVLIGNTEQVDLVCSEFTFFARTLAKHFWPGALTLVVPKIGSLPPNISQTPTIGIRMPDLSFTRNLLNSIGPLAVTSANLSGGPNPKSAQDVLDQLSGHVELILDGGECPGGVPSTVVDCSISEPIILREGFIKAHEIFNVLRKNGLN